MRKIKNILLFFLIIFSISFSSTKDKSTVYLEKRNEITKLKIGITKLKSESLPLEFEVESKKIYGEIEVNDSDLVYVSETLAEIPSVSTTNGRRAINNIKRYLTKEIKETPKFEWKIVKDKEKQKKYIVIDCKSELSGVYIYIVEKDSYKVKKIYKGSFISLFSAKDIKYGTINITKNFFDHEEYRRISYNGVKPVISKISNFEEIDAVATENITVDNYPKKLDDGTKYDNKFLVYLVPSYKVTVYDGNKKLGESEYLALNGKKMNEIDTAVSIKSDKATEATKLYLVTNSQSDYYNLYIKQPYPYQESNYNVVIEYGQYNTVKKTFTEGKKETHSFRLIIKEQKEPLLPIGTKGNLILQNLKKEGTLSPAIVTFTENGAKVENNPIFDYKGFNGKSVEILDFSKYMLEFPESNYNYLRIKYTSNASKGTPTTWEKTFSLTEKKGDKDKKYIIDANNNINFNETDFKKTKTDGNNYNGAVGIYDIYNKYLGDIIITGEGKKDSKEYFKLKFTSSEWANIHREVASTLTFEYITKVNGQAEEILKKDVLNIVVFPIEENIAPDTFGTLVIKNSSGLPGKDLFIRNKKLDMEKNDGGSIFHIENASFGGELPKIFATNGKYTDHWVNIENGFKLVIKSTQNKDLDTILTYETGAFQPDKNKAGWLPLFSDSGKHIGYIGLSSGGVEDPKRKESITIGFREKFSEIGKDQPENFAWEPGDKGVYEKYEFLYQIDVGTEDWMTVKKDVLELIIQNGLESPNPEITLKNPLVYYDYDASTSISNISHNKRAHIAKDEAITLDVNGGTFTKNTNLLGKSWISGKDAVDYPWETLGKHKISISKGTNEVLKNTYNNGGTKSSTYLKGNTLGKINKTENEVMFSYDGGNKYLNFGLSKYNFDEDTIENIVISHFDKDGTFLKDRETYKIIIPRFEGIHYMGSYDIKPKQSYTKNYAYDPNKANTEPIIIDYGTVGFRNLDTRITRQSKGEGIDFRATKAVKLVSVNNSNYVINGVELYFEEDKEEPTDDNGKTSRFKGEDEKATSAMLKLKIPVQETLISRGKYIILTDNGTDDKDNNPLRIGVTVDGNKKEYYSYVDGEGKGKDNKNLYLNLTTNRFVETTIEFENPNLKIDDKGLNWINLDDSDFSGGKLSREINGSNLWGKVKGDMIDIPVDRYPNLKMEIFDDSNSILGDISNGEYKFKFGTDKNGKDRNFIINHELTKKYIRFTLDNGYDPSGNNNPIKFYIRYYDVKEGKKDFLFDQRYIVKFGEEKNYKGDTTVIFKNPSMKADFITNTGVINVSKNVSAGKDNSNTGLDKITWYKVINPISYPNLSLVSLIRIEDNKEITNYKNFLKLEKDEKAKNSILYLGIPNNATDFNNLFGTYNKNEIDKSFELKFANDNSNSYRLNIRIEKFDPKYFGKVFVGKLEEDYKNYVEINEVGKGEVDLTQSNIQGDSVYIDLGTSYRDYLRYESLLGKLKVNVDKEFVDVYPKNANYAKSLKGELVLADGTGYINLNKQSKEVEITADGIKKPQDYLLKLKLSPEEYKKLRPNLKYEIFINNNQNILTIGDGKVKDNIIFNEPLNFTTKGPGIVIETTVLDFGKIDPKRSTTPLLLVPGKTEVPVKVTISGELDPQLGEISKFLDTDTSTIWIKQKSANGEFMANGGKLKVKELKAEKHKASKNTQNQEVVEEYDISGILEVPKDMKVSQYGQYTGTVSVTYTFY